MSLRINYDVLWELNRQGKLHELVDLCQTLLDRASREFGETHVDTASIMAWLAHAYCEQTDFSNAIAWFEKSLAQKRSLYGTQSKEVVRLLNQLGHALLDARRVSELEVTVNESLRIFGELPLHERLECPDPALLMAAFHLHRGEADDSERMLIRALHHCLRSLEHHYGSKDYNWTDRSRAVVFYWLSGVYVSRGQLPAAERTIRKALRILRSGMKGIACIDDARMCRRLSQIQERQGHLSAATLSLQEAMEKAKACRPPDHPDIKIVERELNRLELATEKPL